MPRKSVNPPIASHAAFAPGDKQPSAASWDEIRTKGLRERRDHLIRLLAGMDVASPADRRYVERLVDRPRISAEDAARLDALQTRYLTRRVVRRPAATGAAGGAADG